MTRPFGALFAALLLGCGPEPAAAAATSKPETQTPPDLETSAPASQPGASRCSLASGGSEHTIAVGDTTREYLVHVGSELRAPPAVVFAWHGFGSNPEGSLAAMKASTYWNDAIVVAPRGMPRTFEQFGDRPALGWQVASGELDDRDLALFDALVTKLASLACLDETRVYTAGFSNGGFFSNVLACHRGDVIAAAAPTGGGGPFVLPCGRSVPVLVTHGRNDKVVPYASATKTFTHWSEHNGCDPKAVPPDNGCAAAACPVGATVRMCSENLGHRWPRGQAERTAAFLRQFAKPS